MNNREIIEFAAKAVGNTHDSFDPITNSADCATMCAKLIIGTEWCAESSRVVCFSRGRHRSSSFADHNNDREAAWRHAATMVAAKTQGWKE